MNRFQPNNPYENNNNKAMSEDESDEEGRNEKDHHEQPHDVRKKADVDDDDDEDDDDDDDDDDHGKKEDKNETKRHQPPNPYHNNPYRNNNYNNYNSNNSNNNNGNNYNNKKQKNERDEENDKKEEEEKKTVIQNDSKSMLKLKKMLNENNNNNSNNINSHEEDKNEEKDKTTKEEKKHLKNGCIECEEVEATVICLVCDDYYCDLCFHNLHRKAKRAKHPSRPLNSSSTTTTAPSPPIQSPPRKISLLSSDYFDDDIKSEDSSSPSESHSSSTAPSSSSSSSSSAPKPSHNNFYPFETTPSSARPNNPGDWFYERAKYIPIRLTLEERKYLRLVEQIMSVSEYTDKIDVGPQTTNKDKARRTHQQVKDVCAILTGLVVAHSYELGQELLKDQNFKRFEKYYQTIFEIARRHKIRNPEKMRSAYGKLMYFLQDSNSAEIQDLLEFSCVRPIKTVFELLEKGGALNLLRDEQITVATREIQAENKSRRKIDREVKEKVDAIQYLAKKYMNEKIGYEDIRLCLLSIGDNHSYLRSNRDSCDKMLNYLKNLFDAESIKQGYSLAIVGGKDGARLTHSHKMQYHYVMQSLTLWREILHDMFKLWYETELDLLDSNTRYQLTDTGQGLHRVQPCPRVGRSMRSILHYCQNKVGSWVGSSVIHLGDKNVPNSLMFIDKYNQVARILNPVVITLGSLEKLATSRPDVGRYINDTYGGYEQARMTVLADFFRSAFDGSGADNFFDAGSCIDGRLTSAWHWCSQISQKPFYPLFLLAGFVGFDGEF